MPLKFRNLTVTPDSPVEGWGFEGMLTAVERGDLADWRKIIAAVRRDPWGGVSQTLEQVLAVAEDDGVVATVQAGMDLVRARAEAAERQEVSEELRAMVVRSGLSQQDFARRLGTSASRLSTYLNGKVTPSAALMVRARRVDPDAGRSC